MLAPAWHVRYLTSPPHHTQVHAHARAHTDSLPPLPPPSLLPLSRSSVRVDLVDSDSIEPKTAWGNGLGVNAQHLATSTWLLKVSFVRPTGHGQTHPDASRRMPNPDY